MNVDKLLRDIYGLEKNNAKLERKILKKLRGVVSIYGKFDLNRKRYFLFDLTEEYEIGENKTVSNKISIEEMIQALDTAIAEKADRAIRDSRKLKFILRYLLKEEK